jgi:hypothetical protein
MKNTSDFAIGQILGTKAFNNGIKRCPAMDKELEPYFGKEIGDKTTIHILKGWLFGWDNANIHEYINL